jgi:putative membrane protein
MLDILLLFAAGMTLGVLAGLVPGLHPNTLLVIIVSLFWLSGETNPLGALTLVVSMSVSNAIVNFIPSIFFGAPEPDSCLSVLPGHRLLMEGMGYEALFLTVAGGVGAMLLTLAAFPFLLWSIPFIYSGIHAYMTWLLLLVLALLLWQEKRGMLLKSLAVFLISGGAGFMLLSAMSSEQVLFPAFSGLFGISLSLGSIMQSASLPPQKKIRRIECRWMKGALAGWLAGLFVGILPGIGPAQAGVLASRAVRGNERDFLVSLGGISTSNIVFTFIALHVLGKTRSGAAWALSEILGGITAGEVYFMLLIATLSCFLSSIITLRLGSGFLKAVERMDYRKMNLGVVVVVFSLVALLSGLSGVMIMSLTALMGLSCAYLGVKKMYMMGFLLLPTMLYYSGLAVPALVLLGL